VEVRDKFGSELCGIWPINTRERGHAARDADVGITCFFPTVVFQTVGTLR
jgi:hypothetical protein